jgi:hypothetical protein
MSRVPLVAPLATFPLFPTHRSAWPGQPTGEHVVAQMVPRLRKESIRGMRSSTNAGRAAEVRCVRLLVNGHLALQLVNFKKSGARASVFQSAVSQTPQYNPRGPTMVLPIKGARGYRQLLMVATMNDAGPATRRGKLGLAFLASSGGARSRFGTSPGIDYPKRLLISRAALRHLSTFSIPP